MERETGFEPATSTLARSHSTTELLPLSLIILHDLTLEGPAKILGPHPLLPSEEALRSLKWLRGTQLKHHHKNADENTLEGFP